MALYGLGQGSTNEVEGLGEKRRSGLCNRAEWVRDGFHSSRRMGDECFLEDEVSAMCRGGLEKEGPVPAAYGEGGNRLSWEWLRQCEVLACNACYGASERGGAAGIPGCHLAGLRGWREEIWADRRLDEGS